MEFENELSPEERAKILFVLKKEEEVKLHENSYLNELKKRIEQIEKTSLSKEDRIKNTNYCFRCSQYFSSIYLFFIPFRVCAICLNRICKPCCIESSQDIVICIYCDLKKRLRGVSGSWFSGSNMEPPFNSRDSKILDFVSMRQSISSRDSKSTNNDIFRSITESTISFKTRTESQRTDMSLELESKNSKSLDTKNQSLDYFVTSDKKTSDPEIDKNKIAETLFGQKDDKNVIDYNDLKDLSEESFKNISVDKEIIKMLADYENDKSTSSKKDKFDAKLPSIFSETIKEKDAILEDKIDQNINKVVDNSSSKISVECLKFVDLNSGENKLNSYSENENSIGEKAHKNIEITTPSVKKSDLTISLSTQNIILQNDNISSFKFMSGTDINEGSSADNILESKNNILSQAFSIDHLNNKFDIKAEKIPEISQNMKNSTSGGKRLSYVGSLSLGSSSLSTLHGMVKIEAVDSRSKIKVKIVEAADLRQLSPNTPITSFVLCQAKSLSDIIFKKKTSIVQNCSAPVWGETFEFYYPSHDLQKLVIFLLVKQPSEKSKLKSLMKKDTYDKFIYGSVRIGSNKYLTDAEIEIWKKLNQNLQNGCTEWIEFKNTLNRTDISDMSISGSVSPTVISPRNSQLLLENTIKSEIKSTSEFKADNIHSNEDTISFLSLSSHYFDESNISGSLLLNFKYTEGSRMLTVNLLKAEEYMLSKKTNQSSKIFANCKIIPKISTNDKKTTSKFKDSGTINFNITYQFNLDPLQNNDTYFICKLFRSEGMLSKKSIGQVTVPISYIISKPKNDLINGFTEVYILSKKIPSAKYGFRGTITVSIRFENNTSDDKIGNIEVRVLKANNLATDEKTDHLNSYVCCCLLPNLDKKNRDKSKVVKNSTNPEYKFCCTFSNIDISEIMSYRCLEVTIWTNKSKFIGGTRIGPHHTDYVNEIWQDSSIIESNLWKSMLDNCKVWVFGTIPLRYSMLSQNLFPVLSENIEKLSHIFSSKGRVLLFEIMYCNKESSCFNITLKKVEGISTLNKTIFCKILFYSGGMVSQSHTQYVESFNEKEWNKKIVIDVVPPIETTSLEFRLRSHKTSKEIAENEGTVFGRVILSNGIHSNEWNLPTTEEIKFFNNLINNPNVLIPAQLNINEYTKPRKINKKKNKSKVEKKASIFQISSKLHEKVPNTTDLQRQVFDKWRSSKSNKYNIRSRFGSPILKHRESVDELALFKLRTLQDHNNDNSFMNTSPDISEINNTDNKNTTSNKRIAESDPTINYENIEEKKSKNENKIITESLIKKIVENNSINTNETKIKQDIVDVSNNLQEFNISSYFQENVDIEKTTEIPIPVVSSSIINETDGMNEKKASNTSGDKNISLDNYENQNNHIVEFNNSPIEEITDISTETHFVNQIDQFMEEKKDEKIFEIINQEKIYKIIESEILQPKEENMENQTNIPSFKLINNPTDQPINESIEEKIETKDYILNEQINNPIENIETENKSIKKTINFDIEKILDVNDQNLEHEIEPYEFQKEQKQNHILNLQEIEKSKDFETINNLNDKSIDDNFSHNKEITPEISKEKKIDTSQDSMNTKKDKTINSGIIFQNDADESSQSKYQSERSNLDSSISVIENAQHKNLYERDSNLKIDPKISIKSPEKYNLPVNPTLTADLNISDTLSKTNEPGEYIDKEVKNVTCLKRKIGSDQSLKNNNIAQSSEITPFDKPEESSMNSRSSIISRESHTGSISRHSIFDAISILSTSKITGKILIGLKYSNAENKLEIIIKNAEDVTPHDSKKDKNDTYAKVNIFPDKSKSAEFKTKVVKNTLKPVFNETFNYSVNQTDIKLRKVIVNLYHKGLTKHTFLGQVIIPIEGVIESLKDSKYYENWYPLESKIELSDVKTEPVTPSTFEFMVSINDIAADKSKKKTKFNAKLTLKILSASNLATSQTVSRAFCKVYLLSDKSQEEKKTTAPADNNAGTYTWNENIEFEVKKESLSASGIYIKICDHKKTNYIISSLKLNDGSKKYSWQDSSQSEANIWGKICILQNSSQSFATELRPE